MDLVAPEQLRHLAKSARLKLLLRPLGAVGVKPPRLRHEDLRIVAQARQQVCAQDHRDISSRLKQRTRFGGIDRATIDQFIDGLRVDGDDACMNKRACCLRLLLQLSCKLELGTQEIELCHMVAAKRGVMREEPRDSRKRALGRQRGRLPAPSLLRVDLALVRKSHRRDQLGADGTHGLEPLRHRLVCDTRHHERFPPVVGVHRVGRVHARCELPVAGDRLALRGRRGTLRRTLVLTGNRGARRRGEHCRDREG